VSNEDAVRFVQEILKAHLFHARLSPLKKARHRVHVGPRSPWHPGPLGENRLALRINALLIPKPEAATRAHPRQRATSQRSAIE
jgi:hypothetical protein